jgi:hypothetical protein
MTPTRALALAAAAVALVFVLPDASAQNKAVEEFTATALNTTTRRTDTQPSRAATTPLTIRIERWSTDAERDKLLAIVKQSETNVHNTNQALLRALQDMPRVGSIRESTTLAWDLRFARQTPLEQGGRRIVLGTDRPMPLWELREQPRSVDYPFTVLEIHVDKENRGEGKLLADTRLFIDPRSNDLVLEHYDLQPVRLTQVRPR